MRQVTRKGLITIAAAGGMLAVSGGYAHADAEAQGAAIGSPGVLSGNTVQAPAHAPVNACGNTVTAGGGLNPAFGNTCSNGDSHHAGGHRDGGHRDGGRHRHPGDRHVGGHGHDGAKARGVAAGSPGVASGNTVQAPVHAPVNACGNTVTAGGGLNPAYGNTCSNDSGKGKPAPEKPEKPGKPDEPERPEKPEHPGKPGKPGKPEKPGKPGKPAPEKPGKPGKPEKPGKPGEPEKPGRPGGPEKPGDGDSGKPGDGDSEKPGHGNDGKCHGGEKPGTDKPKGEDKAPERDEHRPAHQALGGALADTGGLELGTVLPVGAGALLGGALLYRRARVAQR